jgi:hypothetical protein
MYTQEQEVTYDPSLLNISFSSLPSGTVNKPYLFTATCTGGKTPYTWYLQSDPDQLPTGLTCNTSGQIVGTPTKSGVYHIEMKVVDKDGRTDVNTFDLYIAATLAIPLVSIPNGYTYEPYSVDLDGVGGIVPHLWTAINLPAGLSINNTTGVISGVPSSTGSFSVTVTLTDFINTSINKVYNMTVTDRLGITTAVLPEGYAGKSYNFNVQGKGNGTPYAWTATNLPTGLTINRNTGTIAGTPTVAGLATPTIRLTNASSAFVTKQFDLKINEEVPTFTYTPPDIPVGTPPEQCPIISYDPIAGTITLKNYLFGINDYGLGYISVPANKDLNVFISNGDNDSIINTTVWDCIEPGNKDKVFTDAYMTCLWSKHTYATQMSKSLASVVTMEHSLTNYHMGIRRQIDGHYYFSTTDTVDSPIGHFEGIEMPGVVGDHLPLMQVPYKEAIWSNGAYTYYDRVGDVIQIRSRYNVHKNGLPPTHPPTSIVTGPGSHNDTWITWHVTNSKGASITYIHYPSYSDQTVEWRYVPNSDSSRQVYRLFGYEITELITPPMP